MQQSSEKLIEQLRSLRLSDAEREAMRASLIDAMRKGSIRQPILSPWSWFFEARRLQAASLIALIIIGYGSSATLAADGSLPGDILYPIKTRVVEPLARLVATRSPAAKADFEAALLDRRLREAEALDDEETLDAPLRETVRENVRAQSAKAEDTARRADRELPPSILSAATSTIVVATGPPARLEETRRPERSGERGRGDEKRAERAARVLKEHKRILEKLELSDERDDDSDSGKRENDD